MSDFSSISRQFETPSKAPVAGWFLEQIWAWFHNQTKMIEGFIDGRLQ